MKLIKKFFMSIFNPINNFFSPGFCGKCSEIFEKHPILIFIISLIIAASIYVVHYFTNIYF